MSLSVHELRTPVTVAVGYLRMLIKEQAGPVNDKQRKMLEEAERACGRISAIVAEMSEMGKLESQELKVARAPLDMAELVAELASDMHEGHDRGVELQVRVSPQPVPVSGDRPRVAGAIRALTHATLREHGEPGTVVATLATLEAAPTPWAVFAVGAPDAIDGLVAAGGAAPPDGFDEWRGGMGLALPVARRVIEALGGAIWSVGDRPRTGAALRLPLATERT